jgi:hypothetical protein
LQVQSPEFKSQSHQKTKRSKTKNTQHKKQGWQSDCLLSEKPSSNPVPPKKKTKTKTKKKTQEK